MIINEKGYHEIRGIHLDIDRVRNMNYHRGIIEIIVNIVICSMNTMRY